MNSVVSFNNQASIDHLLSDFLLFHQNDPIPMNAPLELSTVPTTAASPAGTGSVGIMNPAELEGAQHIHRHPHSVFTCQLSSVLDLKQDFLASLRDDLTSNLRPVIMNLTQIAGENIAAASTITKALEEHIQRVISNILTMLSLTV
jgi:hypothetical protein